MHCPNCQRSNLGKLSTHEYYCWNCLIEVSVSEGKLSLHEIEEDGSLSSLNDLFDEQDLKTSL